MQFKQYPSYKDSGVEWLGEVPEHWEIMQLKSAIKNWRNGKWGNDVGTNKNDNLICVRVADFNRDKGVIDTEKLTYRNYTGETIGSCLLNKNHILIERSGGGENQLVGATVRFTLSEISVCSNFISLLEIKTENFDLRFIQYSFEHLYNLNVNKLSIKQTSGIQNLDLKQYVQNSFSFPHLLEQQKIVSYLDSETTRIDNLIAKQEKLIELLEEQRKSIISHAVTKGLDPNAPMKDSGVEWLGEVPEHWGIVRTKDIFNHRKEEALEDDEIVTAFRDGQVTLRKNRRTEGFTNSLKEHGYQHINSGDLVIHEMDAFAGAIGVSDSSGKSTPVYTVCYSKDENTNHHFYSHFFRTMAKAGFINSLAKGIRVRSTEFRWNESKNVYLAFPPKLEQQKIVSFLDSETSRIDNLIAKQEKLIELLEEYRSSIISHAVTGKIDVREYAE